MLGFFNSLDFEGFISLTMDKTKKLYIDTPSWETINVDDFLVAVGKTKSNSVYHVAEVRKKVNQEKRTARHHVKVYKSELIIALKRDDTQRLWCISWHSRNKKNR